MSREKEDQTAIQKDKPGHDEQKPSQMMAATRVTVDEVKQRMDRGEPFTFVDTRNPNAWGDADTKLPGAIRVPADELDRHLDEIPHDRTVITYCT
jgi:rhodanese-related sulfurtransferase